MNIRIIEAKPKPTRFRVAAYARVSTKKEQQEESTKPRRHITRRRSKRRLAGSSQEYTRIRQRRGPKPRTVRASSR